MTQTLADLFGSNAVDDGTTLTITLADFVDSSSSPLLVDPSTASASQKASAWLAWLHRTQLPAIDANGVTAVDKTNGIVPQTSFQPKTFEVREDETQVKNDFGFAVYTVDNSIFDPDDTV